MAGEPKPEATPLAEAKLAEPEESTSAVRGGGLLRVYHFRRCSSGESLPSSRTVAHTSVAEVCRAGVEACLVGGFVDGAAEKRLSV